MIYLLALAIILAILSTVTALAGTIILFIHDQTSARLHWIALRLIGGAILCALLASFIALMKGVLP